MKMLTIAATVLTAFAGHASAQTADTTAFHTANQGQELRASELIGEAVHVPASADNADERWESVGDIGDLILSRDGQVGAVLVDVGGFLGVGAREVAIRMDQLDFIPEDDQRAAAPATADGAARDARSPANQGVVGANDRDRTADLPEDYRVVVQLNREALENAPAYDDAQRAQAQAGATGAAGAAGAGAAAPAQQRAGQQAAGQPGTADRAAAGNAQRDQIAAERSEQHAEELAQREQRRADQRAQPMASDQGRGADGYVLAPANEQTAENLRGADVWGADNEEIATVADLRLDDQGSVTHVLFDVGGFLGIGSRTVALPMEEVEIMWNDEDGDVRVHVPMSEEELKALPAHEG